MPGVFESILAVRKQIGLAAVSVSQYDVHKYNFSDLPLWDRLFGTYKDTTEFAVRCGFPKGAEEQLGAMLAFKDVYRDESL
jgi:hypothetical protein